MRFFLWCGICQRVPEGWRQYPDMESRDVVVEAACHRSRRDLRISRAVLEDSPIAIAGVEVFADGVPGWRFLRERDFTVGMALARLELSMASFEETLGESFARFGTSVQQTCRALMRAFEGLERLGEHAGVWMHSDERQQFLRNLMRVAHDAEQPHPDARSLANYAASLARLDDDLHRNIGRIATEPLRHPPEHGRFRCDGTYRTPEQQAEAVRRRHGGRRERVLHADDSPDQAGVVVPAGTTPDEVVAYTAERHDAHVTDQDLASGDRERSERALESSDDYLRELDRVIEENTYKVPDWLEPLDAPNRKLRGYRPT